MQPAPALRADVVVERLADEAVREAVRADRGRPLDDDAELDGLAERAVEVGGLELADALQRVEPELAADDRGGAQQLARALGQRREAVADRLAHAVGDPQRGDLLLAVQSPLGAQQPHDLVDEERVALGRVVDRAHDARPMGAGRRRARRPRRRRARAARAAAAAGRGAGCRRASPRAAASSRASASRYVPMTRIGESRRCTARNASSRSDGWSAPCRSSRISTSAPSWAAARSSDVTASKT